jgi:hypothetical protein
VSGGRRQEVLGNGGFRENTDKVCGAVIFSKRNQDTFGRDVEDMISAKLTFGEAIAEGKLPIMARQRLKLIPASVVDAIRAPGRSGPIRRWRVHRNFHALRWSEPSVAEMRAFAIFFLSLSPRARLVFGLIFVFLLWCTLR